MSRTVVLVRELIDALNRITPMSLAALTLVLASSVVWLVR
jgi:hypothetical protein